MELEDGRLRALQQLRARIIHEECIERWRDAWFWLEQDDIRGWQGTQDIFFVGLNPATGRFPSEATDLLYDELRANGFQQAHVTDLAKVRATVGDDTERLFKDEAFIARQRAYFAEELAILRPRLVVPMGKRTADLLAKWRTVWWRRGGLSDGIQVERIPHFAQRVPTEASRSEFRERLSKVRERYDQERIREAAA
jgi:uracil-DNA glycosylase